MHNGYMMHVLLQQEHIVDRIVDFLPQNRVGKRTLLTLLCTAYPLQQAAAKRLYHTVSLQSDADIAAFFAGVEVGTGATGPACAWLRTKGRKTCAKLKDNPAVTVIVPSPMLPPPEKSYEFLYGETRKAKAKAKPKATPEAEADTQTHGPLPAADDEWIDVPDTPGTRNTKAPLLVHVKLLTIGDHHLCSCAHFGPLAIPFLRPHVLRIVANFDSYFQLNPPCDGKVSCPLMTGVRARKLVIRNLDGFGLPLPQFNLFYTQWPAARRAQLETCTWPASAHIDTLVLIFPHHARRYNATNLVRIGKFFPTVPHIKIVFWNEWEGYTEDDHLFARLHAQLPARAEDMVYPIQQILAHTSAEVTVCGLDDVEWAHDGDLIGLLDQLSELNGGLPPLDDAMLYNYFQTEITTAKLFTRRATGDVGTSKNWGARVKFVGVLPYVLDTAARRGELKGTLEAVKPVWGKDGSVQI